MALSNEQVLQLEEMIKQADMAQLRNITLAVQSATLAMNGKVKGSLRIGAQVRFKPRKTKPEVTGNIERINGKTVTITNCSDGERGWRIPPHMLTVIG